MRKIVIWSLLDGKLPIRKIAPHLVQLTSYFSKLKVQRSLKVVDNYPIWLIGQIERLVAKNELVSNVNYGRTHTRFTELPRAYTTMFSRYKSFTVTLPTTGQVIDFNFDLGQWEKQLGTATLAGMITKRAIPCARIDNQIWYMSPNGNIHSADATSTIGTLEECLNIKLINAPIEVVELNVMGKAIPIGLVLGFYYGLSNLIKRLGVTYRSVVRGANKQLQNDEYAIQFLDQAIILSRQDPRGSMIIGSLGIYHKSIAAFNFDEFNSKDVYGAVMDRQGLGSRYVRELDFMRQLYIDHITEELLRDMGEPTEFGPLLIRAVELLQYDSYPRETDGSLRRESGYERIPGAVFGQLVRGLRRYKARPLSARAQVELNPNDVWRAIQEDSSVTIIEESNPIHQLKEQENVTFSGTGGRTSRSLVKRTRVFDPNDLMVISEATVDSSDVGVTTFLTPNPQLKNLRGVRKPLKFDPTAAGSLISTSALISPCSDRDDQLVMFNIALGPHQK